MTRQRLCILILATACAAGFFAAGFLTAFAVFHATPCGIRKAKTDNRFQQTDALVFTRDMPRDSIIALDDFDMLTMPTVSLRPGAVPLEDAFLLVGRRTVNPVSKFNPVYWNDIENGACDTLNPQPTTPQ